MKKYKPERHEYADVFIECAKDKSKVLQFKTKGSAIWVNVNVCTDNYDFRIKPQD